MSQAKCCQWRRNASAAPEVIVSGQAVNADVRLLARRKEFAASGDLPHQLNSSLGIEHDVHPSFLLDLRCKMIHKQRVHVMTPGIAVPAVCLDYHSVLGEGCNTNLRREQLHVDTEVYAHAVNWQPMIHDAVDSCLHNCGRLGQHAPYVKTSMKSLLHFQRSHATFPCTLASTRHNSDSTQRR